TNRPEFPNNWKPLSIAPTFSVSILPYDEFRKQVLAGDKSEQRQAYLFQHPDVIGVWLKTIGAARGIDPYFLKVAQGDLRAFFCLWIGAHYGLRVLSFLDHGVSDYNAPILFGSQDALRTWNLFSAWPQMIAALPKFDVAVLNKMPRTIRALPNPFVTPAMEQNQHDGHVATLQGT